MDAIKNAVSAAKKVKRSFSRRNETVVVVMDRGSRFCECEAKEYNEFLEMKKWRMKLLEEKLQASDNFSEASSPTGVFASTPRTSVETPGGKPFFPKTDSCCSAMISPHSSFGRDIIDHCEHMNGKINLEESSISFHARPPSYPNLSSACDEGYSTSSQNGWPLSYGTRSISSPPSESFDDAYDTSSKSGTITKKEQEELRHLLKTFEDTTSSAESDNDDVDREIDVGRVEIQSMDVMCTQLELTQSSSALLPGKPQNKLLTSSTSAYSIDTENLSVDIKNAVNELLSIGGNPNTLDENTRPSSSLLKEQKTKLNEFGESYENLLENITIFAQTGKFEVLIDSSDLSAVSSIPTSDIESDGLLFETNDSGIDDSMPGIIKEGTTNVPPPHTSEENGENHKPKSEDKERKHRKHRSKETSLHRSESEPRRSSTNTEKDEVNGSKTLPHRKKHREKDATNDTPEDEHVTNSSDAPKKLRHRETEGGEHRKRRSRSRDKKSDENGDTEDSSERRKRRSSRSRERKEGEEESGEKEHRKRSSRSRERRKSDGVTESEGGEKKRHSSRSRERKTEEGGETKEKKRHSSRSRERKTEEDGETKEKKRHRSRERKGEESEKEGGESRRRHKSRERKLDENGEEIKKEHRKRSSRSRDRKTENEESEKESSEGKRKSRSRERKSVTIEEPAEEKKVNGEHRKQRSKSEDRKTDTEQNGTSSEKGETPKSSRRSKVIEGEIEAEAKKERRSEPLPQTVPDTTEEVKTKSRKSEPVSRSESKRSKKKPTVVKAVVIDGPKEVIIKTQDGLKTTDGAVVQKNETRVGSQSSEYMYETPDGKHRVYLRSNDPLTPPAPPAPPVAQKNGPKTVPDNEMITDNNTSIVDFGKKMKKERKSTDEPLSDKYGISSDIISLLREEEKFWQKQQELKEWRENREKDRDEPTEFGETNTIKRKSKPPKNEFEIEEDKLAREAKRLERLRIHQDQLLQKFQDNLLRDELQNGTNIDDSRPYQHSKPPVNPNRKSLPPHYPGSGVQAVEFDLNNTDIGHSLVHQDPRVMEQNYKYEQRSTRDRPQRREDIERTVPRGDKSKRNSLHRSNSRKSENNDYYDDHSHREPNSRAVCFSDDDEVFHEARRKSKPGREQTDSRGYFSDGDALRDNSVSRTYLARPLMRQTKTSLRCTACCKPISDERLMYVEGQNYYWHLKCFYCVVCNAFLNDRHTLRVRITNYRLHCRFCYSANNGEQLSEV